MFIPLFTHADALELAMPEFGSNFGDTVRTIQAPGDKVFPPLAQEQAAGLVLNYLGPTEPLAFTLGILDLLLEHIAKTEPGEAEPAPEAQPQ